MGYIYCIKNNINSKVYIGKSIRDPYSRINEHFSEWELLNTDTKLTRAILKYGFEAWSWDVVEQCSDDLLSEREIYWINKMDSYNKGYNSTLGGDGVKRYHFDTEDIKAKYLSGVSARDIADEYGCHPHYIHEILKEFGIDVTSNMGRAKPIACFDRHRNLIGIFQNKIEIQKYLMEYGYGNSLGNVYHTVSQACLTGKLGYKRYWVELNEQNIKQILSLPKCGIHEKLGEKTVYATSETRLKKKEEINNRCKVCGKLVGANSVTKLCLSCSQVVAKGKSPKPSREELIDLLNRKISVKNIANMYGRTPSTVSTWISGYGIKR